MQMKCPIKKKWMRDTKEKHILSMEWMEIFNVLVSIGPKYFRHA
jgi:hypothetical protein